MNKYDVTYREGVNPALQWYRHWAHLLRVTGFPSLTIPGTNWQVQWERGERRKVIGLATAYNGWSHLKVAHDGRFCLRDLSGGWGSGSMRRSMVERYSFLGYTGGYSRYQWYVHLPGDKPVSIQWHYYGEKAPYVRRPYVAESLISSWRSGTWQELVREGDFWAIRPSRKQDMGVKLDDIAWKSLLGMHERYRVLVDKRYDREDRKALGLVSAPRVSVRELRVHTKGGTLTEEQAVQQLVVLLDVSMPAKSTPLTRPKEAQDAHNVDTQDAV